MSFKRSRATFEADLQAQQSPHVLFGTPLPPLDPDVRDDGSYVPVWKQEVRDERGRKRLHGAFTGGWSAGYFNTVGSKEGWTPSTFVSSRTNRRKDDPRTAQQSAEDFMDEEDLADAEDAKKIQTSDAFAGLGSTEHDAVRTSGLAGLFRVEGETMGTKLLKRMGWREGQGIGPKVRRKVRLELGSKPGTNGLDDSYLFAPENAHMIAFVKKNDHRGLGYEGQTRLDRSGPAPPQNDSGSDEEDDGPLGRKASWKGKLGRKKPDKSRGGLGTGVLNDTGSDDDDPYEVGPRISYNRTIGGDKKKKKANGATTTANPALRSKPKFISKKGALSRVGQGLQKCHDGRLPLDGFVLGQKPDELISSINSQGKYPPPNIPQGWKSAKLAAAASSDQASYLSTADAAKLSKLDPKARAAALGEKQLPGKSVFDFISASARDRLVAATGKANLPQGLGEVPAGYALSEAEKLQALLSETPKLDKETAVAAIARGAAGGAAYADNEEKRARYRTYLEHQAGFGKALPSKPHKMSNDDFLQELNEFYNCARIFKPMTGMMASRFTTSSSSSSRLATGSQGDNKALLAKPPPKPLDPAEEAAKMGMYGSMTRSVKDFYPSRLLCKRFNVKPPTLVQPDETDAPPGQNRHDAGVADFAGPGGMGEGLRQSRAGSDARPTGTGDVPNPPPPPEPKVPEVDSTKNEALEGKRAGEEVFKAIFGDSSDEDD